MNEWWALRDSILLNEVDTRSKILESLRASYFHLSDDLKECILLCSFMEQGHDVAHTALHAASSLQNKYVPFFTW